MNISLSLISACSLGIARFLGCHRVLPLRDTALDDVSEQWYPLKICDVFVQTLCFFVTKMPIYRLQTSKNGTECLYLKLQRTNHCRFDRINCPKKMGTLTVTKTSI